jgi:hypothetical protein
MKNLTFVNPGAHFGKTKRPLDGVIQAARKNTNQGRGGKITHAWWVLRMMPDGTFRTHWFNTIREWSDREPEDYYTGSGTDLEFNSKPSTVRDWELDARMKGYTEVDQSEWPCQLIPHECADLSTNLTEEVEI